MKLGFWIARKYFFSKKKAGFINFISIISTCGIALGTMALIIILSVFNGLEDLNRQIFKAFDPDLKISSKAKKTFDASSLNLKQINGLENIKSIGKSLDEKGLARYKNAQMIVQLKGVDSVFLKNDELQKSILEGDNKIFKDELSPFFIGSGVLYTLGLSVDDFLNPVSLLYPNNSELDILNPESNINTSLGSVKGAFALEQQYDNYVYLPLKNLQILIDKPSQISSLDISLKNQDNIDNTKKLVQELIGPDFMAKDRDQQNEALFKAIKIEKLFIFISLFFIIGIASFTIFYGLSMLVLDKKDDIFTLSSLGLDQKKLKTIFMIEGYLIGGIGIIIGSFLGLTLCFLQQKFGFVKLGMQYALVNSYPVKIIMNDILISIVGLFFLIYLVSFFPSKKALNFIKIR